MKKILIQISSTITLVLYPCLFMYFNNIGEAKFKDIIPISIYFIIIGMILIGIGYKLFKNNIYKAVFMSNIISFILINFKVLVEFIQNIMPKMLYWHCILIVLFLLYLLYLLLIDREIKELESINKIIAFVFSILIVYTGITATPNIIKNMNKIKSKQQISSINIVKNKNTLTEKPNFYFVIFDEYAGPENMEHILKYDNNAFYEELKKYNVNVSYTSRNRETSTVKVIPDLVHFTEMHNDNQQGYEELVSNPPLLQLFKEYGYEINKVTSTELGTGSEPKYRVNIKPSKEESAQGMILKATILYPINFNISTEYYNNMNTELEYFLNSIKIEDNGIFSVGHFVLPHMPFIYDENGNNNPTYKYNELIDDSVYLGQLKYLNKNIIEFFKRIIEKDPNAIVLFQSDHGCRLPLQRADYLGLPRPSAEDIEYMKSILNILYYKGEVVNIEGMSGYDTLKLVTNKILGTNIK